MCVPQPKQINYSGWGVVGNSTAKSNVSPSTTDSAVPAVPAVLMVAAFVVVFTLSTVAPVGMCPAQVIDCPTMY